MLEKVVLAAPFKMLATNVLFYRPEPFAAQDLEIEVIYTGSGEPVVQALLNGDAGFTHVCGAPLPAAVAGRGLKVLAAFQFSSFELYAHPDIKSLSQLKGKTITLTGSVLRPNLETALRRRGLSIEDVQIAPREATSGVDQLRLYEKVLDGTLDAITANPPGAQAAQLAGLQCLLRFGDIRPIPTCALLTTDVLLRENRDQVKRFTKGLMQSIDDFVRDRALGIHLIKGLDLPDEVAIATYEATRANLRPTGELAQDVQRLWTEWSKPLLGIEEDVPLDRAFDTTVLHEILDPGG